MGNEIAQFREWDEKREQDWSILKYPMHNNFYKFMKKLNNIYLEYPALYENDYKHSGFKWIDCHQEDRCIYVFERICSEQRIIAIFNFSNEYQKNYELKVDSIKKMRLIIDSNSDDLQNNESQPLMNRDSLWQAEWMVGLKSLSARTSQQVLISWTMLLHRLLTTRWMLSRQ